MVKKRKADKSTLVSVLTLAITILILAGSGLAQEQSDTDVTIEISDETIIDIQPAEFAWGTSGDLVPGSVANEDDEQNQYASVFVENLGSVDIQDVYFETSKPNIRPFGTGDTTNYDPANFVALEGEETDHLFVERRDYALEDAEGEVTFLSAPEGWHIGRFRNASEEYFWALEGTADGDRLRIGVDPRTEETTGSTNLADDCAGGANDDGPGSNDDCNEYDLSTDGSTSVVVGQLQDGSQDDGSDEYCAIADAYGDNNRVGVDMVKWNPTREGADSGGCSDVTDRVVDDTNPLVPGEFINIGINSYVPYGVPSGTLDGGEDGGILTVYANSAAP